MATYDAFAREYSMSMGEEGDYFHKTQIDPYVYKIIGDPKGKSIYDLGCGNGYMSRILAKKGAKVASSDNSKELIEIAKHASEGMKIEYQVHDALKFDLYKENQFDAVVLNMVVQYIDDLDTLFEGISRVLKKGGVVAFSMPHFLRPMSPYSDWEVGELNNKKVLYNKITGYLSTEPRHTTSIYDDKTKITLYNHPLSEIAGAIAKAGLNITHIYEPESKGFAKSYSEELQKSHHIPTFMIMGLKKF